MASEDVADEDLTNDAADAGVASSDTSSSEAIGNRRQTIKAALPSLEN